MNSEIERDLSEEEVSKYSPAIIHAWQAGKEIVDIRIALDEALHKEFN